MERLSYGFVSLFALGIVTVSLSHVLERHIPSNTPQAIYENDPSFDDNPPENYFPPANSAQFPLNLTKPIYHTTVIFHQPFPRAVNQQNVPHPVMQPVVKNQGVQGYAVPPIQSSTVQIPEHSNGISATDEEFFTEVPRKLDYDPHQSCKKYLKQAAEKTGILPEILWAVAKTESNYEGGPWPWAINVSGKGYYFPTQEKAREFLKSLTPNKKYQVDVGCMQVNWGYHGENFPYLSKMLNPRVNTMYGAQFLKELYKEMGNWAKAIAAYHSRNQRLGTPYASHVALQVEKYPK